MTDFTDHEIQQVDQANATGLAPVVFIHGLWLLPSSWDRWAAVFEQAGLTALTPDGILRTQDDDGSVYVLQLATPLDLDGELTCDWRDGDVW